MITKILAKDVFSRYDIIKLLRSKNSEAKQLFEKAETIKNKKNHVYFRGLIEFSNICYKNCYYCGIRAGNKNTMRYDLNDNEILEAIKFAHTKKYGSIVLQAGERDDDEFIEKISRLLKKAKQISNGELGITLSLGEQTQETYKKWFDAGAHRYLLRIETTNETLYQLIHPNNKKHSYQERLKALKLIQKTGYQTGTGVMIGLPFQSVEHLADDLLFMKDFNIDMVGMGPYIEHKNTPLFIHKDTLWNLKERFEMSLKMVAILRIMMPDINIAATTAMQTIDPVGREKAIKIGANVIMPNITPKTYRKSYQLYDNKPCIDEDATECIECLDKRLSIVGAKVQYGEWGDSKHFFKRTQSGQ